MSNDNNLNINFYSSFIFIANSVICYIYNYYLYSFLFSLLTITSLLYHSSKNSFIKIVDQIVAGLIVMYGGYVLYKNSFKFKNIRELIFLLIIILTFLGTIFLYYYGYLTNSYCFHENMYSSQLYHTLIHVLSCLGHSLIVII